MRFIKNALMCLAASIALSGTTEKAAATLYCNRPYAELTLNPGRPYNAVGYLNNGCTASLIDPNHIVAAAHCLVDTKTGAWQTGLRFYPNFHPNRVTNDATRVPRADVTRVVVGSRTGESMLGWGMDWGIARVENWRDTTGLDLAPLTLYAGSPSTGIALINPAYTRHHFPYNDNDAAGWDNMLWDTAFCGWVGESAKGKNDGGVWAVRMGVAPFHDSRTRDWVGCNSRWRAGMVHANCSLKSLSEGVAVHNCNTIGGSSGSPLIYQGAGGAWSIIGVTHGGGSPATAAANEFSKAAPTCAADTASNSDNGGPSVQRFLYAPRFAENVAVHRRPDKASATAVFAIDSDLNRVVARARQGNAPTHKDGFDYWQNLRGPAVQRGAKLTQIAACSADASGKPQIFVVVGESQIATRSVLANGNWSGWSDFGTANAAAGVVDIDASTDAEGRCQLFMVAKNGGAFMRAKTSDTAWGGWSNVASGSYKRITALNYAAAAWVAMLDSAGEVWRTSFSGAGWTPPVKVNRPPSVFAWRDIDFTWDEGARGFLVAVPTNNANKLWFMPMYGSDAWVQWRFFDTHLWAPESFDDKGVKVLQNAPKLQSVTASRWMEDLGGMTSPVIFATDDQGNVYFIEYARVGTAGWILDWKSFYHEKIPY